MSETDDFLADLLPRLRAAEKAVHDGDLTPRLDLWTRSDPVTLLGAAVPCCSGWEEVLRTFDWLAARFGRCTAYEFELVAAGADGDLAYTVGFEHTTCEVEGVMTSYTLRATQVYRREDGRWRVAHRHADTVGD